MAFVLMFMSLIVGVYSQRFCMSLSLTTTGALSEFNNGQFVDKGGSNDGKPYYEMDNTNQTGCDNPGYLYWNNNPANNWFIGKSLFLWKFKCTTIINNNDPSTCTNWDDSGNNAVGAILIAGNCPYDAMCDTITLSQPAGNCSGVFNYIKPNQFTNGNGQYLIYQEKIEKWICWKNIINVIGCPLSAIPNTWRQDDPSGMKQPFQDGDSQTYAGIAHGSVQNSIDFTCSGHNTRNPSPAPSNSPTQSSNNPTSNPSKSPSRTPTTPIPSSNPSQIPTHSPSIPTSNPSNNPTMNPTVTPTRAPTKSPTLTTLTPSNIPTKSPIQPTTPIPTPAPTDHPTDSPTDVPTEYPSKAPTEEPTKGPTKEPSKSPSPTRSPSDYVFCEGNGFSLVPHDTHKERFCKLCFCDPNEFRVQEPDCEDIYSKTLSEWKKERFMEECSFDDECSFDQIGLKHSDDIKECGCKMFECQPITNDGNTIVIGLLIYIAIVNVVFVQ